MEARWRESGRRVSVSDEKWFEPIEWVNGRGGKIGLRRIERF